MIYRILGILPWINGKGMIQIVNTYKDELHGWRDVLLPIPAQYEWADWSGTVAV